jgi:hypothetical protein
MTSKQKKIEKILKGNFSYSHHHLVLLVFHQELIIYDEIEDIKFKLLTDRLFDNVILEVGIVSAFPLNSETLIIIHGAHSGFYVLNIFTDEFERYHEITRFLTGVTVSSKSYEDDKFVLFDSTGSLNLFSYSSVGIEKLWELRTNTKPPYNQEELYRTNFKLISKSNFLIFSYYHGIQVYDIKETPILIKEISGDFNDIAFFPDINEFMALDTDGFLHIYSLGSDVTEIRAFIMSRRLHSLFPLSSHELAVGNEIHDLNTGYKISCYEAPTWGYTTLTLIDGYLLPIPGDLRSLPKVGEKKIINLEDLGFNGEIQKSYLIPNSKLELRVLKCILNRNLKKLIPTDLIRETGSFLGI